MTDSREKMVRLLTALNQNEEDTAMFPPDLLARVEAVGAAFHTALQAAGVPLDKATLRLLQEWTMQEVRAWMEREDGAEGTVKDFEKEDT